jgi:hypothetical protein
MITPSTADEASRPPATARTCGITSSAEKKPTKRIDVVPEAAQTPWRGFGGELGLLFQIVDDILDGDGYVLAHGPDGARRLADEAAERARARLGDVDADTSVLREIVDGLAVRTT